MTQMGSGSDRKALSRIDSTRAEPAMATALRAWPTAMRWSGDGGRRARKRQAGKTARSRRERERAAAVRTKTVTEPAGRKGPPAAEGSRRRSAARAWRVVRVE